MATNSSTLTWKIPWTEECGRLQTMGSQRVGHDWATLLTNKWKQWQTLSFLGGGRAPKITVDGDYSHEIKRRLPLGRKVMTNLDSKLKSRHYFANKNPSTQSYGFSNSHVWMWEFDYKESWVLKNWCFSTVMLEKTLESSLDSKEI